MVSVLHKQQEYKVEKPKLQEGWRSGSRGSESNPNFQMANKPSWIKFYSRDNNNNNNNNIYRGSPTRQGGFQWGPHALI